jgi:hypothetical protein
MKLKRRIPNIAVVVLLLTQLNLAGAGLAMAEHDGHHDSPSPTPEESASPSPSDSPEPSSSPSPSVAPSDSPEPAPTHSDAASPSPSASSTPDHKYTATGPDGCGGVIPDWVYDTTAGTWSKADKGSFSCDKGSGYYLSPLYTYDKRSGWYEIMPAAAPQADYLVNPSVVHTSLGDIQVGSKDYQMAKSLGLLSGPGSIVVSGSGPDSKNEATVNNSGAGYVDLTNMVNVINNLKSGADSGNVTAGSNTQVGNSTTGAASVVANLINLLASAWAWSNGNLSFFMQNILGNQNGDLTLAPTESRNGGGGTLGGAAAVDSTGPNSNNVSGLNNTDTLDVKAKNQGNIVNNVDLAAASGNANATGNTSAGNVASGQASAEVNIINMINSLINSGSSFFGILNIMGNLNGDVLFPNGFLNGLVPTAAAPAGTSAQVNGTGPDSNNQAEATSAGKANITNSAFNGVSNKIQTTAASGAASADSNSQTGPLSSGAAKTTQGLFNLANSSVLGDNAVLVIVNVLGHWIGTIMNLPGGGSTESALLTGNATVGAKGTGPDSNNQAAVTGDSASNIDQSSVGTITNNVNVNAKSGDASARRNTSVGSVSTGNSSAASSVANIFNSVLNLKHWFGVLVINVFGDWTGDVNHNSAAGSAPAAPNATASAATGLAAPRGSATENGVASTGRNVQSQGSGGGPAGGPAVSGGDPAITGGRVLTASAHSDANGPVQGTPRDMSGLFALSAAVMLIAGALASAERKSRRR